MSQFILISKEIIKVTIIKVSVIKVINVCVEGVI